MTKVELVKKIAQELDITQDKAGKAVNLVFDSIMDSVANEGRCMLNGMVFKKVERAARKGRNPKTGQPLDIPAKTYIRMVKKLK